MSQEPRASSPPPTGSGRKRYRRPPGAVTDVESSRPTLVPLQTEGDLPTLYFLPGYAGTIFQYYRLAPLLGSDQPVVAFESRGLWGDTPPFDDMDDIAEDQLRQLREDQPHGPYFLLGFSMGGSVAWEMAQRLQRDGEEVFLGLLDPPRPDRDRPTRESWIVRRRHRAAVMWFHWQTFWPLSLRRKRAYLRPIMQRQLRIWLRRLGMGDRARAVAAKAGRKPPPGASDCQLANLDALDGYVPEPLDADITLFRGKVQNPGMRNDRTLSWGEVAPRGIEVVDVPGLHPYIFVEPHVKVLAQEIRRWAAERRALLASRHLSEDTPLPAEKSATPVPRA